MDLDNILDDSGTRGSDFYISDTIRTFLSESARWAKFIAIVTFVFMGLGVLSMLIGGGAMLSAGMPGAGGGIVMLIYILFLGVACIPVYYLYQFATKMQVALRDNNQAFLQAAFENHKSMFKFYGIFLAILLGIYALIFVIGIFGAAIL